MRDWIAGAMAVLGMLLVISGGAVIVLRALRPLSAGEETATTFETPPAQGTARLVNAVRRMPAADRLIGWGVVLFVLGAVAAGAISFNLGAEAGTR
jgi:hypothetical protein